MRHSHAWLRALRPSSLVAALFGVLTVLGLLAPAASAGTPAGDAAEGWYDTSQADLCTSPLGCPPVSLPRATYPAGTLHIGVSAGQEEARTYVRPDLSAYSGGELPSAGTMTLPLATVSGSGNSDPAGASIKACLSTAPFPDGVEGSTSSPPPVNCDTEAPLRFNRGTFTLDLARFLGAWGAGQPEYGIALVPDLSGANPTTSWQVAFNARSAPRVPHIESSFSGGSPAGGTVVAPSPRGPLQGSPPSPAPAPAGASAPQPATGPTSSAVSAAPPSPAGVSPSVAAFPGLGAASPPAGGGPTPVTPPAGEEPATGVPASSGAGGFQYPEILLLPLVLAGGVMFVIRMLTTDATPRRARPITVEETS